MIVSKWLRRTFGGWRSGGQHRLPKDAKTYTFARDRSARTRIVLADRVASHHLQAAQARSAEVSDLAAALRLKRENNHFEETIRRAVG